MLNCLKQETAVLRDRGLPLTVVAPDSAPDSPGEEKCQGMRDPDDSSSLANFGRGINPWRLQD